MAADGRYFWSRRHRQCAVGGPTDATCKNVLNIPPTQNILNDVRPLLEANEIEIYCVFCAHLRSLVKPPAPTPMTTVHLACRGGSAHSRWEHTVPKSACSRTATSKSEPRRQNLYQSDTASYRPRGPREPPTVKGVRPGHRCPASSSRPKANPSLSSRCRNLRTAHQPLLIGPGYTRRPRYSAPRRLALVWYASRRVFQGRRSLAM